MKREAERMPLAPITMRTTNPPPIVPFNPSKKKKKEEKLEKIGTKLENDVEEELDEFFL